MVMPWATAFQRAMSPCSTSADTLEDDASVAEYFARSEEDEDRRR
jgi:hypothetical protein